MKKMSFGIIMMLLSFFLVKSQKHIKIPLADERFKVHSLCLIPIVNIK